MGGASTEIDLSAGWIFIAQFLIGNCSNIESTTWSITVGPCTGEVYQCIRRISYPEDASLSIPWRRKREETDYLPDRALLLMYLVSCCLVRVCPYTLNGMYRDWSSRCLPGCTKDDSNESSGDQLLGDVQSLPKPTELGYPLWLFESWFQKVLYYIYYYIYK